MRNTFVLLLVTIFIFEVYTQNVLTNLEIQDSNGLSRGQYYVSKSYKVTKDMIGKMKAKETTLNCESGDSIINVESYNEDHLHFEVISKNKNKVSLGFFTHKDVKIFPDKNYVMTIKCVSVNDLIVSGMK